MSRKATFKSVCSLLAAKRCRQAGQSVAQIAKSAKKSKSTIYRWLKQLS